MKKVSSSVTSTLPAIGLSIALGLAMVPTTGESLAYADDSRTCGKEETVYVSANSTGSVKGIYVVNMFDDGIDGIVEDPANYTSLRNLSTEDVLVQDNGTVKVSTSASDPTYYQGELDAATTLPWNISATYWLDGNKVDPKELSGASGNLRIELAIEKAPDTSSARDFAVSYVVQAQATFDEEYFRITKTDDITMARAGNNSVATGMVLPGESRIFVIEGQARDFSYPGWQISAMPLSLALDVDDQDTSAVYEMSGELKDATSKLADGSGELYKGTKTLSTGSSELAKGTDTLKSGSASLVKGSKDLSSGASEVSKGLGKLSAGATELTDASGELTEGWGVLSSNIHALSQGAAKVKQGSDAFKKTLKDQRNAAQAEASKLDNAQKSYAQAMGAIQKELKKADPDRAAIAAAMQKANEAVEVIAAASGNAGAAQALSTVESGYGDLGNGIDEVAAGAEALDNGKGDLEAGLTKYSSGVDALCKGVSTAHKGAKNVAQGSSSLLAGARTLDSGVAQVQEGAQELSGGSEKLREDSLDLFNGMTKLRDSVRNIDREVLDELQEVVDSKLGAGFKEHSFVVPSNTNVSQVQFVYVLDGIDEDEDEKDTSVQTTQASGGFVDRLVALFRF